MAFIRYIGRKATKIDNVAGTAAVWTGHGDVQEVNDRAAAKLIAHPDVWELTTALAPPEPDIGIENIRPVPYARVTDGEGSIFRIRDTESDEVIDLGSMIDSEIKTFARINGFKVDFRRRGDELRALVMAAAIVE